MSTVLRSNLSIFWMDPLKFRVSDKGEKKGLTHPLCNAVRISCVATASSDAWLRSSIPSSPIAICHLWSSHERRRIQSNFATADFPRLYMWRRRQSRIDSNKLWHQKYTKQQSTETRTIQNLFRTMRRSCCIKRRELLPREVQVMQTAEFLQGRHQVRRTNASWYTLRLCQHRQLTVHLYLMPLDGGSTIGQ
jgi:hypothetical protein